ncbi:integrase core domain-containing protein [Patescibacteria group bacterium]|nr:integrase core domain-containing protein [Patescibacteria group bacterium]
MPNAHLERFNKTIQNEFLKKMPHNVNEINKFLPEYLEYYNAKRLHLGIDLKTPIQLAKCFQTID